MTLSTQHHTALPDGVRKLLAQRIEGHLELPIQSSTSAQVMALCNDERCNAAQLSDLIAFDQALSGHVLAIANSAMYAPVEPILSLQQAVARLGLEAIREIALAISLKGKVFDVPGYATLIRELWMQSAATAAFSREVALYLHDDVEGAFLCGLLHNVGMPIVLQNLVDMSRERTDRPIPSGILWAAMDEFHQSVGGRMVRHWDLPEWVAEVIQHYHKPEETEEFAKAARICLLGRRLATWALADDLGEEDFPVDEELEEALGITPEGRAQLLAKRGDALEVAEAFL